jgi:hypothetical protein
MYSLGGVQLSHRLRASGCGDEQHQPDSDENSHEASSSRDAQFHEADWQQRTCHAAAGDGRTPWYARRVSNVHPSVYGSPQMVIFIIDKQSFHHVPEAVPTFERLPG